MCGIVERFNPHVGPKGIRQDLFGFIDIIAVEPETVGCIGVQACAGSGAAAHLHKIVKDNLDRACRWLMAHNRIQVWAWRKVKKKRGGKLMIWKPRIVTVTLADEVAQKTGRLTGLWVNPLRIVESGGG